METDGATAAQRPHARTHGTLARSQRGDALAVAMHIVRQGESLSSIAHAKRLASWRRIYDHPNNAEFRRLRPDPNILFPGDRVFVPERDERTEQVAGRGRGAGGRAMSAPGHAASREPIRLVRPLNPAAARAANDAFAGSRYEADVFKRFVEPLLGGVSALWGGFRDRCSCATCAPMQEDGGGAHAAAPAQLDLSWWKAKDLKIGTRTAPRLVDLVIKYPEQIGRALHETRDLGRAAWTFSFAFMLRTGGFNNRPLSALFERWRDAWMRYYEWALVAGNQRNANWDPIKKELEALKAIPRGKGLERVGHDVFKGISTAASLIGAAITMYDVLRAKHLSAKNYADSVKSATELVRGVIAFNDIARNGGYEKYVAKLYMAQQVDEASALAMAKAAQERLTMIAKWAGVIGGVWQLFTAGVAIQDSAERGDGREYSWAWVQGIGAGLSMLGLWMDCSVVGSPAGVILNVVGGAIYLAGGAGEWLTRPNAIEVLSRNEGLWLETPQWRPGELEEVERIEALQVQRWVEENRSIHPFDM